MTFLERADQILRSDGWEVDPIEYGELQFRRPEDPERCGLIDDTGHIAFPFNDDWQTLDDLRELLLLLPAPLVSGRE